MATNSLTLLFPSVSAHTLSFLTTASPRRKFHNFLYFFLRKLFSKKDTIVIRMFKKIVQMLHIWSLDHFCVETSKCVGGGTKCQRIAVEVVHAKRFRGLSWLSDNEGAFACTSVPMWPGKIGKGHVAPFLSFAFVFLLCTALLYILVTSSSMEQKYNLNNPSIKRIMREVKEMEKEASCQFKARPLEVHNPWKHSHSSLRTG